MVKAAVPMDVVPMDVIAAKGRPVALARTRLLEVDGALGGLLPAGGLQRGSVVEVAGGAAMSLSLALAAGVMPAGSSRWAAAVGFPSIGLVAAAQMGVPLERLALVPAPGERWAEVVAALLDGVDLLLLSPPAGLRASDARRLAARARERGVVLVPVRHQGSGRWPESPEVRMEADPVEWTGLGAGFGYLRHRRVEIAVEGRRVAGGRRRSASLWMPGPEGVRLAEAVQPAEVARPAEVAQGGAGPVLERAAAG